MKSERRSQEAEKKTRAEAETTLANGERIVSAL
jgi:hypothetical protein